MKKIFTLIAAVLMTVCANAQMISFGESDVATAGTLDGTAFGDRTAFCFLVVDEPKKMAIDGNNCYFGTAETYEKFTHRLKSGGKSQFVDGKYLQLNFNIPAAGVLRVGVRTGSNSATDRNMVISQNEKELYNKVVVESDAVKVTGLDESDPEKETSIYPVVEVNVVSGEALITFPTGSLNFYFFEFVEGASVDDPDNPDTPDDPDPTTGAQIDFPNSTDGITISGSTAWDNSQKYHANADTPKNISFSNGYTTEGVINDNYAALNVEGGFKAGDVVSVAGYFNNTDDTKQAAVTLFVGEKGETNTDLWTSELFINGRTVADDPEVQTYTLESDYESLKLGRANGLSGATRTNVTLLKVERPTADGLKTIVKVVDNGAIYNLAGQQVRSAQKGIYIQNGKKFVVK